MKLHLPDFKTGRVLVTGDLMLDRYWHGSTSRISPEAPVPVIKVGEIEQRAGGAGNVALNIAALSGQVNLLALVGTDEAASALETLLTDLNVVCHFVAPEGCSTITKLRVISRNQQLIRLDFEDTFSAANSEQLIDQYEQQLSTYGRTIFYDQNIIF